jgi:hypothetical protein
MLLINESVEAIQNNIPDFHNWKCGMQKASHEVGRAISIGDWL